MSFIRDDDPADLVVTVLVVVLLVLVLLAAHLRGADRRKDVVFVCPPEVSQATVRQDPVACATTVWFNGDWSNAKLCHGARCWRYVELFPEAR